MPAGARAARPVGGRGVLLDARRAGSALVLPPGHGRPASKQRARPRAALTRRAHRGRPRGARERRAPRRAPARGARSAARRRRCRRARRSAARAGCTHDTLRAPRRRAASIALDDAGSAPACRIDAASARAARRRRPRSRQAQRGAVARIEARARRRRRAAGCCSTASPAAARPRSTCARSPAALERGRSRDRARARDRAHAADRRRASSERFGDAVAVLHSKLGAGERYDEWVRLRRGEARVCVGPRSAVFAPLHRPRADRDRRGARRARTSRRATRATTPAAWPSGAPSGAARVLVAGTATPRPGELAARCERRRAARARRRPRLPPVEIVVDGRRRRRAPPAHARRARGRPRRAARRRSCCSTGAAGRTSCPAAAAGASGSARSATSRWCCTAPQRRIACHHCGHRERVPSACPDCGSVSVARHGAGTERLEAELAALVGAAAGVPPRRRRRGRARGAIRACSALRRGADAGVLVGTQMVAKGHDFPDVTLGVVLDADSTLRFPDFRAEERTFALVAQLAGRSGRGAARRPGDRAGARPGRARAALRRRATTPRASSPASSSAGELLRYPPFGAAHPGRLLVAEAGPRGGGGRSALRELHRRCRTRRCSARRRCSACKGRERAQLRREGAPARRAARCAPCARGRGGRRRSRAARRGASRWTSTRSRLARLVAMADERAEHEDVEARRGRRGGRAASTPRSQRAAPRPWLHPPLRRPGSEEPRHAGRPLRRRAARPGRAHGRADARRARRRPGRAADRPLAAPARLPRRPRRAADRARQPRDRVDERRRGGRSRRAACRSPASPSTSSARCTCACAPRTSTATERVVEASGLEARVIQHEMDHLNGVLILDRTTQGPAQGSHPRSPRGRGRGPRPRRLQTVAWLILGSRGTQYRFDPASLPGSFSSPGMGAG